MIEECNVGLTASIDAITMTKLASLNVYVTLYPSKKEPVLAKGPAFFVPRAQKLAARLFRGSTKFALLSASITSLMQIKNPCRHPAHFQILLLSKQQCWQP